MKKLLIIFRQFKSAEKIREDLVDAGYGVHMIGIEKLGSGNIQPSAYDLAIIHSFPDLSTQWEIFLNIKERFPNCPILLYIRQNTVNTLIAAIEAVFREKATPSRA